MALSRTYHKHGVTCYTGAVVVSTDKLRRNLDGASIHAEISQTGLRKVLQDLLFSRWQASNSGYKLGGTSANGASTQITTDNSDLMLEVWSVLLTLFDTCNTALGGSATDAEVLAEMKFRLDSEAVTNIRHDFSEMRSLEARAL